MVVVEITVRPDPGARTLPERVAAIRKLACWRAILATALLVAILATAAALLGESHGGRRGPNPLARRSGPAGVAAAYGYPLRCLSITIFVIDRSFARADFNHMSPCGRFTGYSTAIFHRVGGAWRPVLDAVSYICPVASLPIAVQIQLGVCPQPSRRPNPLN